MVAPFWADIDIRIAGEVLYQVFNSSSHPELLEEVNAFISAGHGGPFAGQWMLVADWRHVAHRGGSPAIVCAWLLLSIVIHIVGESLKL